MVGDVTSLLRCVKTAEDTHGRSEAATEAAIEAIGREIVQLHIDEDQKKTGKEATPEDLVAATRAVTEAVAGLDFRVVVTISHFFDQPIKPIIKRDPLQVWCLLQMKTKTKLLPQSTWARRSSVRCFPLAR